MEKQKYSSHPQAKKVDVHKHHSMISSLSKEKKYGLLEQCECVNVLAKNKSNKDERVTFKRIKKRKQEEGRISNCGLVGAPISFKKERKARKQEVRRDTTFSLNFIFSKKQRIPGKLR